MIKQFYLTPRSDPNRKTIPGQNEPESIANEGALHIP